MRISKQPEHLKIDSFWGPVDAEIGWVPSLRYLLRRACILSIAQGLPRGRLLEIGCGAGALLIELFTMGFDCVGLETSEKARRLARHLAQRYHAGDINFLAEPASEWMDAFDVVCAFDVLEHIEHDTVALARWLRWLRPGGILLLSVPAHSHRWGPGDEWAGHYRRYDRKALLELLALTGLRVSYVNCYGFPLANLTEWMGRYYYRKAIARRKNYTCEQASATSGIDRKPYVRLQQLLHSRFGQTLVGLGLRLQNPFLDTDWGSGYLVMARRP